MRLALQEGISWGAAGAAEAEGMELGAPPLLLLLALLGVWLPVKC